MEKVIKDGKVAVVIQPQYGIGWSTWNSAYAEIFAFHPRIVEAVLEDRRDDIPNILKELIPVKGYYLYVGGVRHLKVQWVPLNTQFQILEEEGSESIEPPEHIYCITE